MHLGYRIPGQWHEDSPSEQQIRKLLERMEEIERSKGVVSSSATEREKMEVRVKKMEEEAKERERVTAEHQQQLTNLARRLQDEIDASRTRLEQEARAKADLERHLQDTTNASAANQSKWERIGKEHVERYEAARQKTEEQTKELRGQVEKIQKDSECLGAGMKEMEQEIQELQDRTTTTITTPSTPYVSVLLYLVACDG